MPTATSLLLSPGAGATLHGTASIRVHLADVSGYAITEVSISLDGLIVPAPVTAAGAWRSLVDTGRYPNGAHTLRVDATHETLGAVYQEISVTVANSLQSNVSYQAWQFENERANQRVTLADVGLRTYALPAAQRLRFWTRLALFTDQTPGAGDVASLTEADDLEAAFPLGQTISLGTGKHVAAGVFRPESQAWYASDQQLTYPGQTVTALLRTEPSEIQAWWTTPYQRCVKLRRGAESETGTEIWHALYVNLDGSGAGVFEFRVTGSAAEPAATWTEILPLTEDAPEAVDFCIADGKIFVLRPDNPQICVFDLDAGDFLVGLTLPKETRQPAMIESVGGLPVVVCVDPDAEADRSRAWQLTFPSVRPLWTLDDAVTLCRATATAGTAMLAIAAGTKLYTSSDGAAAPSLSYDFGETITCLGLGPSISLVGLHSGALYRPISGTWTLLSTMASDVLAACGWIPDGETVRAVAGIADPTLLEEGLDGSWGAGATMSPPAEMAATIDRLEALEYFERLVSAADGNEGDPDYIPAVYDRRLLVGTGDGGLFGTLQRSTLSAAAGAFLSFEHNEMYLMPQFGALPAS